MLRCGFYPDNCLLNESNRCSGDQCDRFNLCHTTLALWLCEGREFPVNCVFEKNKRCDRIECMRYLLSYDCCHLLAAVLSE